MNNFRPNGIVQEDPVEYALMLRRMLHLSNKANARKRRVIKRLEERYAKLRRYMYASERLTK